MTKKVKVQLLRDVRGTGKRGQILDVTAGFAEHALIPRGDAVHADAAILRRVLRQAELKREAQKQQEENESIVVQRLQAMSVVVFAKSNERGVLYGSVSRDMIAKAICEKGIPIEGNAIIIKTPITSCGECWCTVRLSGTSHAKVKIIVRPA